VKAKLPALSVRTCSETLQSVDENAQLHQLIGRWRVIGTCGGTSHGDIVTDNVEGIGHGHGGSVAGDNDYGGAGGAGVVALNGFARRVVVVGLHDGIKIAGDTGQGDLLRALNLLANSDVLVINDMSGEDIVSQSSVFRPPQAINTTFDSDRVPRSSPCK